MSTSTAEHATPDLPHIIVPTRTLQVITAQLQDRRAVVIHQDASMEGKYGLEVVADVVKPASSEKRRLRLLGGFTLHNSVSEGDYARLQTEYVTAIKGASLDGLDVNLKWMNGTSKSPCLNDKETNKPKAISWFSSPKTPPYILSVSNQRKETPGNFEAIPPEYDPDDPESAKTLESEIVGFMQLLSITHRALGGTATEYLIDYVGIDSSDKTTKKKQSPQATASKHFAANTAPKAEHDAATIALDKEYAPRLPNPDATLEQVHGIHPDDLKRIREKILVFKHPEIARDYGVASSGGIFLHDDGRGGTGKTMLATAIKNEAGAVMWGGDGPDFINKYVGESATKTKEIFEKLIRRADKGPVIFFMDEVDTSIGTNLSHNDSAERGAALGQARKEIAYMAEQVPGILLIAATNNMDKVDESFMRNGRFDLSIYMQPPDALARHDILQDHLGWEVQGRQIFDTENLFAVLPLLVEETDGMTGATIGAVLKSCRAKKFAEHIATGRPTGLVTGEEILDAFRAQRQR